MTQLMKRNTSAYDVAKAIEQERADRGESTNTKQFVNHFIDSRDFNEADNGTVRLRFLYNMRDESGQGHEMLVFRMHDYFIPNAGPKGNGLFVRAICAQEYGLMCHWCKVAEPEIDRAKALPAGSKEEKTAKSKAMREAYQKAAQETFVLPCFLYGTEVTEDGGVKQTVTPKLYPLKAGVRADLMAQFETGIEVEVSDGTVTKLHDITIGDFTVKRSGTGKDTRYTPMFVRVKPLKFTPPTFERITAMIEECRPYKVVEAGEPAPGGFEAAKAAALAASQKTPQEVDYDSHDF